MSRGTLPTPADTNAQRLRATAREFQRQGFALLVAASVLDARAKQEWPQ